MSFIYSQALVEAFSQGNCLDIKQSVQSSANPTPKPSLLHDKTMEASRLSRFGMTCEPLTESLGAELLTWWLAAFHARTYQQLAKALESTANEADCGQNLLGLLAKYDPDTHSLKTAQCSLLEDLTECSVTLPRSGLMLDGQCWELLMLGRVTKETGYGYLPNNETFFHTPNTTGLDGGSNSRKALKKRLDCALPTPTAHDAKDTGKAPSEGRRNTLGLAYQVGGKLNPMWVEWLMGWPIGQTDLKPLETVKFPNALQQHGEYLEAAND